MHPAEADGSPRPRPSVARMVAKPLLVVVGVAVACMLAVPGEAPDDRPSPEEQVRQDRFVRRFRLAQQHFGSGRDDEAERLFRELLEEEPDAAAVHHALAYVAWHRGQRAEAIEGFQRAAQLAPDDGAIRRDCGLHLVEAGRAGAAVLHLEAARALLDADVETLCALGRAYEANQRSGDAEEAYRLAHNADRDAVDPRALLAQLLASSRPEESLRLLEGVPLNWPDVVSARASALEHLDRWADASAGWARLGSLAADGPGSVPVLRAAAEGLLRTGGASDAVKVAERWVAVDRAGQAPALRASVCLATARAGTGDVKGAIAALDASPVPAAAAAGVRAHVTLMRADLLFEAGRADDARGALRETAALDAPFERAAARFLLGDAPQSDVEAAAERDSSRRNDVAWVLWRKAVLAGDAGAAAASLAKAREGSKPPGEHPGALLRSR